MPDNLKVLIVAAEMAPFAKVGGLADVIGALPAALAELGCDVRVALPCYRMIENDSRFTVRDVLREFQVRVGQAECEGAFVREASAPRPGGGVTTTYLIGNRLRGDAHHPYFADATDSTKIYAYRPEPYVFFCRAALGMLAGLAPWQPDVIHCNDWHTGLIPAYLQQEAARLGVRRRPASVFTVHNLAYQGDFPASAFPVTGLPWELFNVNGLEFYGKWTFMKGGLVFGDRVNTVSERYAAEIQTREYGCGLDGLMRTLAAEGKLSGILNGIDYNEFDPAADPRIPRRYDAAHPAGKADCKRALQAEFHLPVAPVPVIGIVSRLADQKGFDLITAIASRMLSMPLQLVLLGAGSPEYQRYFTALAKRKPDRVAVRIGFDVDLAQRIYAGSDMFLMPSRFEPCGLGQLISLRYGTIPIVRATGGLADTILDYTAAPDQGNGFVFTDYDSAALLDTLSRALKVYGDAAAWSALVKRAMDSDFSWHRSARRYTRLYGDAVQAAVSDDSRQTAGGVTSVYKGASGSDLDRREKE